MALLSASPLPECKTAASAVLSVHELQHARAKPSIFTLAWAHTDKQSCRKGGAEEGKKKTKHTTKTGQFVVISALGMEMRSRTRNIL